MNTALPVALATFTLVLAACNPRPARDAPAGASAPPVMAASVETPPPTTPLPPRSPPGTRCEENFKVFDANADQRVSLDEFQARPHAHPDPEAVFRSRDADADGSLTATEFCSQWQTPMNGPPRGGPGPGGRHGAGPGPGMGPGRGMGPGGSMGPGRACATCSGPRCEDHFKRFDTDASGNISAQEFMALPHPRGDAEAVFSERDQDHDGQLSKEEFCAPWTPPKTP